MKLQRKRKATSGAVLVAACFVLAIAGGCSGGSLVGASPEAERPAPAEPPPPQPQLTAPPVDIVGRWRLAAASGGACFMSFGVAAGAPGALSTAAAQGTIAPEGGCPGNFFTSRKWAFEDGALIIRDFKGQTLARLAYSGDHFQGEDGALTLARQTAR